MMIFPKNSFRNHAFKFKFDDRLCIDIFEHFFEVFDFGKGIISRFRVSPRFAPKTKFPFRRISLNHTD